MTEKLTSFTGRIWMITDENGILIDDIDTDMIFHNAHLAVTDIKEMGKFAFGNMKGWEHFAKEVKEGDLMMAGRNFGSGSSRQQAVDCFVSLGVKALICESYGAIYKRNAINSGFPIITAPNLIENIKKLHRFHHLEEVTLDINSGQLLSAKNKFVLFRAEPLSEVQIDTYMVDGLLNYNPEKKV